METGVVSVLGEDVVMETGAGDVVANVGSGAGDGSVVPRPAGIGGRFGNVGIGGSGGRPPTGIRYIRAFLRMHTQLETTDPLKINIYIYIYIHSKKFSLPYKRKLFAVCYHFPIIITFANILYHYFI